MSASAGYENKTKIKKSDCSMLVGHRNEQKWLFCDSAGDMKFDPSHGSLIQVARAIILMGIRLLGYLATV